ncbi:MAG TPA: phosphatase PAP2 family protein [Roseiarcus sp.]|nr:phosphatase PAP2 family protein [Roseiarcus sp.]
MAPRRALPIVLIALTLIAMAVFAAWPDLDLAASRIFFESSGYFIARGTRARAVRDFFNVLPFVVLAAFALLYALRRAGFATPYAPSGRALIFLIATMAAGPGLVVNVGLKDHAHRPRPVQTEEFGGPYQFRPWYLFNGGCPKNCSFVSGEASEAFWMVAPASLAPPPLKSLAIGAALLFGVGASLMRLAAGAHYLSDVVLAALFTLLIIEGARQLFLPSGEAS